MVAYNEAKELAQKKALTSSCCPAFVSYIRKQFPSLENNISHNLSPMGTIAEYIKTKDPEAKVIFIGPCTAKKMEFQQKEVRPYVDSVLTFEELQALFDSKDTVSYTHLNNFMPHTLLKIYQHLIYTCSDYSKRSLTLNVKRL